MVKRIVTVVLLGALFIPASLAAQDQAKIRNALTAAPGVISSQASVMDWDMSVLREGTNGWTCLPDYPASDGDDPMCVDGPFLAWLQAYATQATPDIDAIGFSYMLAGDAPTSNTDPFATGPTADNEWLTEGTAHLMMVTPDPVMLEGIPTYPDGGPWVMWRDTPYAHVMMPLTGPGEMLMIH